jgi:triacylglycerol lipase
MIFNLFYSVLAAVLPQTDPVSLPGRNVVLVHGIWDRDVSMFWLRRRLEREGYRCVVPSLSPNNARLGLADLSEKLRNAIEAGLGPEERFSIVAFSMGGLVSRHYLIEHDGASRCDTFITISTPHRGTVMAYCHPGKGSREMRPRSQFLMKLRQNEGKLRGVKCYSYRTPLDLIIVPAGSSRWEPAVNRVMFCLAHPLMLVNRRVANAVVADLDGGPVQKIRQSAPRGRAWRPSG